jgi:hypothetical protein
VLPIVTQNIRSIYLGEDASERYRLGGLQVLNTV